jgi:anti-sigma factor RsiW
MRHPDIDEHQVIDRYVLGKLPPEEAELFEDHYLSCPQCLDQLALAESMQRGFKRAAGQDVAVLAATRQLALFAWLSRLGRSRQAAVLAMALLVVAVAVLPGSLALRRLGNVDRELAETRRALGQERERTAAGSRTVAEIEKLRAELDASRRDLTQEREARAEAAQQLAQAQVPQANVPILFLDAVRGGSNEEPTQLLRRPPGGDRAVLALQVDPPLARSYQVILRDAGGRELWRGKNLHPDERETLSLSVPGSLLEPGDYTLAVEGAGGPAGRFTFRVLPPG